MGIPHHILKEVSVDRAVDLLLADAWTGRASELTFDPTERDAIVRMRRDGLMHELFRQPKDRHAAFLSRLKRLARLREDAPLASQNGRFRRETGTAAFEASLAVVPVLDGEKAVLRFWNRRPALADLGLSPDMRAQLQRMLRRQNGLCVLAGPRRSGLTTSLRAFLAEADPKRRRIALIENEPAEDAVGIDQQAIGPAAEQTGAALARQAIARGAGVLGLDPLHDEAAAAVALSAAEHRLVIVTMQAKDAFDALARLLDFRLKTRRLADALIGIMTQRLVRRVCPACRRQDALTLSSALALGWPASAAERFFEGERERAVYRGAKCRECRFTGHQGQIGVFELLDLSESGRPAPALFEAAAALAFKGVIAPEEALRL